MKKTDKSTKKVVLPPIEKPKDTYIGHITYPLQDHKNPTETEQKIKDIFFLSNTRRKVYSIYKGDKEISTKDFSYTTREFAESLGYTIKESYVDADMNKTKHSIQIKCENKSCYYYSEQFHGYCRIKMKATIEHIRRHKPGTKNKTEIESSEVVVIFPVKDITELTVKTDCILRHVVELTDVMGVPDHYGKMEMC